MKSIVLLMIAKRDSLRLKSKNIRPFCGRPLYEWNLEKLVRTGLHVCFDSDGPDMRRRASEMGAQAVERPEHLRGHDVPSVSLFQHIVSKLDWRPDAILNLQANSPNTPSALLRKAITILRMVDCRELLTFFADRTINGSLWGFSFEGLMEYGDPYVHEPDILLLDDNRDIHTEEDFVAAERIFLERGGA